jgi:type IV fimbrial biogenesis protein FimT
MTGLPPLRPRAPAQSGFTLMELLITVVCAGILLSLAVPAFRTFMQNDQQWTEQNALVLALNAARSEAIKQDTSGGVQVCASADGTACSGGGWSTGWIALNAAAPAGMQVLQSVGALPTGSTLTEVSGNTSVVFLSNGLINTAALVNPALPVAFRLCDARGPTQARYLQVNAMGRIVASQTIGKDLSNNALTCP